MSKITIRILSLILGVIIIFGVVGVSASWEYHNAPPESVWSDKSVVMNEFEYITGGDEMITGEVVVTEKFIEEINKDESETILHSLIESRKDKGSWFASMNELAADDPEAAGIKELLGLDEYPDLTVIIKFLSGSPAYELYTTRVDVDAVDENSNFVITDEQVNDETMFIYPVNRITFTVLVDGTYMANTATKGYSRVIWYYETPTQQSDVRTFDVVLWDEGRSMDTALTLETGLVGKEVTVQNEDESKEVWFKFTPSRWGGGGEHTLTSSISGVTFTLYNSNGREITDYDLTGGSTYYIKVNYQATTETPENVKFTLSKE